MNRKVAPHPPLVRVGDVLIARNVVVTPHDVITHHHRHPILDGSGGRRGFEPRGSVGRPPGCSPDLVLSRAVGSVLDAVGRPNRRVVVRNVGRLRLLSDPVVGEPLTPVATVRYVSDRHPEATHVTVSVALHRRSGHVLASFELGVEIPRHGTASIADQADLHAA